MLKQSIFYMPTVWVQSSGTRQTCGLWTFCIHAGSLPVEMNRSRTGGDIVAAGETQAAERPPVADAVSAQPLRDQLLAPHTTQ